MIDIQKFLDLYKLVDDKALEIGQLYCDKFEPDFHPIDFTIYKQELEIELNHITGLVRIDDPTESSISIDVNSLNQPISYFEKIWDLEIEEKEERERQIRLKRTETEKLEKRNDDLITYNRLKKQFEK